MRFKDAFGRNGIDDAMLVTIYGPSFDGPRKYAPPALVRTEKYWITGEPDMDRVSASYVESHNTRMRTNIRRLTRLWRRA